MPLLRVSELALSAGHHVLLENAAFQLYRGDKVALLGRNGAGKSTLLKLVEGSIAADSGEVWRRPGLRVARLDQELPAADDQQVFDVIASGMSELGGWLHEFHTLSTSDLDQRGLQTLQHLQEKIEAADGWRFQQQIDTIASRLGLDTMAMMSSLSGGWRRRVSLAKALVTDPDVLLLDEPTNHLDLQTIQWLEQQLLDFRGAILFITHDRALVRSIATQIIELDRGQLRSYAFGYTRFLEEREHQLAVEAQQNALFDKHLSQEEVWIRQGIKARRTRNEGRVRALESLRRERAERRERQGTARLQIDTATASGKLVAELDKVSFSVGGRTIVRDLDLRVMRGDKIGLLGPNGIGKTTLIKLILGELAPTAGDLKLGTKLEVAYFDQMREQLDGAATIQDTVGQGRESIDINGQTRHVLSYLSDFLFSPERARTPLRALSGGERNRVQLACLFSTPANLLVMDEPTNDLDVETLELLEALLAEFTGTLLLVSHDREFMDNIVSSTLVFEGAGRVTEYVGGYQDWLRQGGSVENWREDGAASVADTADNTGANNINPTATTPPATSATGKSGSKLSYKLQRELDSLPGIIETLEARHQQIQEAIAQPDFYSRPADDVKAQLEVLADVEKELELTMERWMALADA